MAIQINSPDVVKRYAREAMLLLEPFSKFSDVRTYMGIKFKLNSSVLVI
jgi:hypothetical protein